jgi:hypothetical protein
MHDYLIRASSEAEIIAILAAASEGSSNPYVWDFEGATVFRESCVIRPWAETVPGDTVEVTDPETSETVTYTPMVATGDWLCRVLVEAPDEALGVWEQ